MGFSKVQILVIFVTINKLADKQNVKQDKGGRQRKFLILSIQMTLCWCSVFPRNPIIKDPSPWSFCISQWQKFTCLQADKELIVDKKVNSEA